MFSAAFFVLPVLKLH